MRNHPAERARQIEAVERAGHDPELGTWPGDSGGPTGEARLADATGEALYRTSLEDCENFRAEDCAGPMSRGADGLYRCDVHADAYADVHDPRLSEVMTPPSRSVVIDPKGPDPAALELEVRLTEEPLYRSSLEDCENFRAEDCAGPLSRGADGLYRCDIHADVHADVHDDPEGELPPSITTPARRRVVEINQYGHVVKRDIVPAPAIDPVVLENEARAAEVSAKILRAQAQGRLDRARNLRHWADRIRRSQRSRG